MSGEGFSGPIMSSPRNTHQREEESADSIAGLLLSGDENSDPSFKGFANRRESSEAFNPARRFHFDTSTAGVNLAESPGQNVLSVSAGKRSSTLDVIASVSSQVKLGFH